MDNGGYNNTIGQWVASWTGESFFYSKPCLSTPMFEIVCAKTLFAAPKKAENLIIVGGLYPVDSDMLKPTLLKACKLYRKVILVPGEEEYRTQARMTVQTINQFMWNLGAEDGLRNFNALIDECVSVDDYEIFGSVFWPTQKPGVDLFRNDERGRIFPAHSKDVKRMRGNSLFGANFALNIAKLGRRTAILITHYELPPTFKKGELIGETICGKTFNDSLVIGLRFEFEVTFQPGRKTVCGETFIDVDFSN